MENKDNPGARTSAETVKQNEYSHANGIWRSLRAFISELLDIRQDTDWEATIDAIKKDISLKGQNAWILIYSIFVDSIGLNVSSTAVVFGAKLLSPLMLTLVGV